MGATRIDTIVIGAGQAGLALSWCLSAQGHDHVVLERGRVGERWRSERWDSFRLLTPNWQTRLPGHAYGGPDPDGFMRRSAIVDFFDAYAQGFAAPVRSGVDVRRVSPVGDRWRVTTSHGDFDARVVAVATGHYSQPNLPSVARHLPAGVDQLLARDYRNPDTVPRGSVLVVGSGPSGQQIAAELATAGREVFIAVGRHRPLPRRYRGRDVYWWLDRMGSLTRTVDSLDDPEGAASAPSAVLAGGTQDLDLHRLVGHGVTPLGRLVAGDSHALRFGDDLPETVRAADAHPARFRAQVDAYVDRSGLHVPAEVQLPRQTPGWVSSAPTKLSAGSGAVGTVIWAAGYRRDFSWIDAPIFTASGEPIQRRGVTAAPGLVFLGLRFMHRRNSNFIDGVGADAAHVAARITGHVVEDEAVA